MSAPTNTSPASDAHPAVSAWSCFHCRRRKVRCDRRQPCFHCLRGGLDCTFPNSGRPPTRRCHPTAWDASKNEQSELLRRIRRLEEVVSNLATQLDTNGSGSFNGPIEPYPFCEEPSSKDTDLIDADTGAEIPGLNDTRSSEDDAPVQEVARKLGKLFTHQTDSLYVGNRLLEFVYGELKNMRQGIEDDNEYEYEETTEQFFNTPSSIGSFIWESASSKGGIQSLQPLPSQVPFIWQTFVENVDPWIKVLHVPSISNMIKTTKGRFNSMTPGTRAVMFSVCLATITSLSEEEVMENFNDEKSNLLAKWTLGTEQALSQAGLINTTDLNIVQAFTIYLEVLGQKSLMRPVWVLGGLLYRIALSMGLHRDASNFSNVSVFNAEMRRRVWWHICFSDSRAGDCHLSEVGLPLSIFDTRIPSHINDADMSPDMTEMPTSRDTFTDSTLCSIRCTLWRLARLIKHQMFIKPSQDEDMEVYFEKRLRIVGEMREYAVKEFQRTDPENPLHKFLHVLISLEITKYELAIHFGSLSVEATLADKGGRLFFLAAAILDHTFRLETQPSTEGWRWVLLGDVPWHAMTTCLTHLVKFPWSPVCERAWRLTKRGFDRIPAPQQNDPMRQPLHQLLQRVGKYRQKEIERLRGQSEVMARLGHMARLDPCTPELGDIAASHLQFDISGAEERLQLESKISQGEIITLPGLTGFQASQDFTTRCDSEDMWVLPIAGTNPAGQQYAATTLDQSILPRLAPSSFTVGGDVPFDGLDTCDVGQGNEMTEPISLDTWNDLGASDVLDGAGESMSWLF